jgi:hypothetical protein
MRLTVVFLLVVLAAAPAGAANYYVSGSVVTSGNGSLGSPFKTIQEAANVATAGSNVYIRSGTYRETVTMTRSGTSTSPITFQPYQNESVTITGLDPVNSGWAADGSGYYHRDATVASSYFGSGPDVFAGGQPAQVARWPNPVYKNPLYANYNYVGSRTVSGTDASVTPVYPHTPPRDDNYWHDATMSVMTGTSNTTIGRSAKVTTSTNDTVNFKWPDNSFPLSSGDMYCLTNAQNAVTAGNQWYYDSTAHRLGVYSPGANPNNGGFEFRSREFGFILGDETNWQKAAQYVTVKNLQFKAANIYMAAQSSYNTVDHCQVLYPDAYAPAGGYSNPPGVEVVGPNNTVKNSEIAYAWGNGLIIAGGASTIDNNLIHDVGMSGGSTAAIAGAGTHDAHITNNTVYNTGFSGIAIAGETHATVSNNDVSRFGCLNKDLGGIHTGLTNANGTVISYNRIHDSHSGTNTWNAGIMLDSGASSYSIHHNLVYNTRTGVELNGGDPSVGGPNNNVDVYNNTIWNTYYAMAPNGDYNNIRVWNNLSNTTNTANGVYWTGTTTTNNLRTDVNQFRDSSRGDYRLASGVTAVNYGMQLGGVPGSYYGSAPDAGAYELNPANVDAAMWTAGANFKTWLAGDQFAATLSSALCVRSDNARSNASSLNVGKSSSFGDSYNRRSFVKFDLTGISTVNSAVLRLYESQPSTGANGVTLYKVGSSWDENTTDLYGTSVGASLSGWYDSTNLGLYTDIDVTDWVKSWLASPSSNNGLSLRSTDETGSGTGKWWDGYYGVTGPQLIITVPEPASFCLLASAALTGLGVLAWRKRKSKRVGVSWNAF